MDCTVIITAVILAIINSGLTQVTQVTSFGPYATSISDGQQQLQYQTSGTPVQGLRLQLSNPAGLSLWQQSGAQPLPASAFSQKYILQIKVKPTADRMLVYETRLVPSNAPIIRPEGRSISSFAVPQLAGQPTAFSTVLPQQQQQQQQPLQFSNAVLASAAQFQNSAAQTFTSSGTGVRSFPETSKTTQTPGLIGVAFSPASDVSQLRFSGSFANYSY